MSMNIRKELRLDGYTRDILEDLKASGKFGNESSIIRLAIQEFARVAQAKTAQTPRLGIEPNMGESMVSILRGQATEA